MGYLIFGAGGQLGQEWSHFLNDKGVTCRGLASTDVDITRAQPVRKALDDNKPEIVVNCAAYTAVDRAEEDRERALKVNAEAAGLLAGECRKRGILLVHFSTDYVFAGTLEDKERLPEGYTENQPVNPVNWYGETKRRGEEAVRSSGVNYLILRLSWLCGKYGSNFVKTMLRLAEPGKTLKVVNDQWGSPTFTDNVVHNTIALIRAGQTGTFHVSSRGLLTWFDFAKTIFQMTQDKVNVEPVTSEQFSTVARRPYFSKLSTAKLASVRGTEVIPWKEGLKKLLEDI